MKASGSGSLDGILWKTNNGVDEARREIFAAVLMRVLAGQATRVERFGILAIQHKFMCARTPGR